MNEQERLESMLDEIMKDAASAAAEDLGNQIPEPDEDVTFSAEHEAAMHKLFMAERKRLRRKKWVSYSKRAACIILVLAILSGITVFSVEAWRVKFLNFVFHTEEPNTDYNFSEPGTMFQNDEITLGYIPEGFELQKNANSDDAIKMMFSNGDNYFMFSVNKDDVDSSIDTENGMVEKIKINGYEGVYTSNKNINAVIWYNNDYVFRITGDISKAELVHIAENIKIS